MPHLLDKKNVDMLTAHGVMSVKEIESRCEIMLENYCKSVLIEANTMIDMTKKQILPAIEGYLSEIASTAACKKEISADLVSSYEKKTIAKLSSLSDQIDMKVEELEKVVMKVNAVDDVIKQGYEIRDNLLQTMSELRVACDEAEMTVGEEYWPFPTYGELLFGVC